MISYLFLFLLAYAYANWLEWIIHKHLFHGLGKKKKSIFATHWHTHHRSCRKQKNHDHTYKQFPLHSTVKHEVVSLAVLCAVHVPLLWVSPFFYGSLVFFSACYFYLHRRSHTNVDWGKKYLPWHYDHHMGRNQDSNWGVTSPLWDWIMGTRIKCLKVKSQTTQNS